MSGDAMSKVFCQISTSLDGFVAGPNGRPGNPLGDQGTRLHQWVFGLASWREAQGLTGGQTGRDDEIVRQYQASTGAHVMGRRMFDEGEVGWPEDAPFHTPVFVVTNHARDPWVRKGWTTFHFVTDGIGSALRQAQAAAGDKDVMISGGANTIQQYLGAGLVDELEIHLAPLLLGDGVRLFGRAGLKDVRLERVEVIDSPLVTHLRYRVVK